MGVPYAPGNALGVVRWGVFYAPTGRWVAFGTEARCRSLVAHLTEVDAILTASPTDAAPGRRPGG
jgi:hypothetical protein